MNFADNFNNNNFMDGKMTAQIGFLPKTGILTCKRLYFIQQFSEHGGGFYDIADSSVGGG